MGMNAGAFHLIAPPPSPFNNPLLKEARNYPGFGGIGSGQCQIDRVDVPCDIVQNLMRGGAATYQYVALPQKTKKAVPQSIPGLNPFAGPSLRKPYGNRPWAQNGNGLIEFGSTPNQFAGLSVSRNTAPQNTHEIIPFGNVFRDMDYLLSNSVCHGFISDLIKNAEELTGHEAYSYDARELIQTIATETDPDGGYFLVDNGGGQGSAWGDIWAGTAGARIETRIYNGPPLTAQAIRDNQLSVAMTGLHETIHGAGGGNNA
jgi:hypothetical protein